VCEGKRLGKRRLRGARGDDATLGEKGLNPGWTIALAKIKLKAGKPAPDKMQWTFQAKRGTKDAIFVLKKG